MTIQSRIAAFIAVLLVLMIVAPAAAQETRGTIAGTVTEQASGQPIYGAQVYVAGTSLGAVVNTEGRYSIAGVPSGTHVLQIRMIGFGSERQQVTVRAGQTTTQDFVLERSVITLDEVVVTGAGVAVEKKQLGNTIATISSAQLEDKPITTFSEAISGREPGVVALPSGGLTGEGTQIRIRGTKSLSQSNEPIVYLNGVRIDAGGGRGEVATGGGGMPSRLDDIDPNTIERIEILKGAAAATLYGSEASSGVIQIFTKQGSATDPRWTLEIEQGALNYPGGAFEPNAGFVTTQAAADALNSWWNTNIQPYEVFERDMISDLFETGYSSAYSATVSGGSGLLTYFAGGRFQYEDGPIGAEDVANGDDKARRAQATVNLTSSPRDDMQLRLTSMYTQSVLRTISNNNNIYAPITLAIFGQPQRASCVTSYGSSDPIPGTGRCTGVGNERGQAAFATVDEALQREVTQDAEHFNGSLGARYTPVPSLALDLAFGVDVVNQRDIAQRPFGHNIDLFTTNNIAGERLVSDRNYRELSLDGKLSWESAFMESLSSQFVLGAQGFMRRTEEAAGEGRDFPGPGFEVIEAGAIPIVYEASESVVSTGIFGQEQLGWNDWVFVTLGARYDFSSAFGESAGGALYPKASISAVLSDRPEWNSDLLSTLRLRAAVGQSGLQPGAFDKLTTYAAIRSEHYGPGVIPGNLGNPELKPEVATEWEVGGEAGIFRNRALFEITYWDRTVNEALVQRQFPVTGGFRATQLDNIGQIQSHGIEVGLRGLVVNGDNVQLNLFVNGAYLSEEITDMGGAPPLKVGGSYPRYRNWLREGFAPGAFFGPIVRQGVEYPIDVNADCQPDSRADLLTYFATPRAVSAFAVLMEGGDPRPCSAEKGHLLNYLGKPTPDWSGAFGGDLMIFQNFRVSTMFEYKAGDFWVHNLTDAFRRAHLALGGNLRRPTEVRAILADPSSTAEERLAAADEWARRWAALTPYDGLNEVERADFVRWRELSLAYDVPADYVARLAGARSVTLTLTGRNLYLWTKYSGADPEINLLGRTPSTPTLDENFAQGIDAFGLPLPRRYSFSVRVGF